ncbi:error-prone DNA polymerase [Propionimicrobium sp. PCR01-08-3]|uniref:error-prone DNA polymerase n=1 Tax=Propionimicrobium sp. PCR01-08-3 TaxID=3052086 RepID=UPI00255C8932|nr:error-prone DNA polymerase [Propionimicrobium sp. PCR01-08-3]WIY84204.1 error-prone DNA polymerase [Propionimicrobium sp. PCR01-08-3]
MGYHNPPITWRQLEGTLTGRKKPDESDAPFSWKRGPYQAPPIVRPEDGVPYAELHAHSSFSFLDGASGPAELVEEAERLGLYGMALTDHDGLYGIVRFAEAAEQTSVKTIFGAELSLELPAPQKGVADPVGSHLLVLARGEEGYHRLAGALTAAQLAGKEKGRPVYDLDDLADRANGEWVILTGCRKGTVRQALVAGGPTEASRAMADLVDRFGREQVYVELTDHGNPMDSTHNDVLAELAGEQTLPVVATGNVHYANPGKHQLAQAVAAVRANRSMDELDGWLPAAGTAFVRSGAEMQQLFARYPDAVERTVELADELAFPLRRAKPALPKQEVPPGHTPMSWLRELVWQAVPRKYPDLDDAGRTRIAHELEVIETKDFPGYFLIVHDIVAEARRRGILCQGRGSAANSAICYLLDITAVDAIFFNLPFERFLSSLREEEPDIDVDFDSDRREEIIQWVFEKYGRERAAQVCNVIQYRPKNAVRDIAKSLGYSSGQQDAFSRDLERHDISLGSGPGDDIPSQVASLANQLLKAPRHLGIHSGGMVLTERPVGEVVPIEHARMPGRTVIQWDKDDAAWMGLVKFDLLGLGMLAALQHCFDLIQSSTGEVWELATLPKEEKSVYDMLCRADSIGVFQVESRAQMGLLPRLQPRRFYDLAIQIALIRPGPIQGGAVHPFVRRKLGRDPVSYLHPKLEPVLARTLGVPVFQEQLMQMAMAVGDCSGEDADLLRRAMGSKRGLERIESVRERLYAGMKRNGLDDDSADIIYNQIQAFANFGFAESHSLSFALLVYASSWLKLHYPAAFLAGLLRAQPMGFYSSETLTADARRHGVEVRRPDLLLSGVDAGLELGTNEIPSAVPATDREHAPERLPAKAAAISDPDHAHSGNETSLSCTPSPLNNARSQCRQAGPTGMASCLERYQPPVGEFDPNEPDEGAAHRRDGHFVVRLGLTNVHGIGRDLATRIVTEREQAGKYRSMEDLVRRTGVTEAQLTALATAGAFDPLGLTRRQALWRAGTAALDRADTLPGTINPLQPPLFEDQTGLERLSDDLSSTGVSVDDHAIAHIRNQLAKRGVLTSAELRTFESGRRVQAAGLVTHRQRPSTASGITFMNLEDEFGLINVICSRGLWQRYRRIARSSAALIVRGKLERSPEGIVNLLADRLEPVTIDVTHRSRDFQ